MRLSCINVSSPRHNSRSCECRTYNIHDRVWDAIEHEWDCTLGLVRVELTISMIECGMPSNMSGICNLSEKECWIYNVDEYKHCKNKSLFTLTLVGQNKISCKDNL